MLWTFTQSGWLREIIGAHPDVAAAFAGVNPMLILGSVDGVSDADVRVLQDAMVAAEAVALEHRLLHVGHMINVLARHLNEHDDHGGSARELGAMLTLERREYTFELGPTVTIGGTYSSVTIRVVALITRDASGVRVGVSTELGARTMSGGGVSRPVVSNTVIDAVVEQAVASLRRTPELATVEISYLERRR